MPERRSLVVLGVVLVLAAAAAPVRADRSDVRMPPGCSAHRPVLAHRAGGRPYRGPEAEQKPLACGMFTGYGGSEARVGVTADGTVVYEPAVLTPGLGGTGYVPGAPGPRPQTQFSPGGLAISSNQGATWRFVKPAGVTWTPQDDQLFVDRRTGRIFWYALEPNPVPQSGGVDPENQVPFGYANLLTSADDGGTWTYAAVPGYAASENPRFAAARPPRGQPKPANYPHVVYWCGNNALFVYGARECWRSLDGGLTWQFASVLFHRGPSSYSECGGQEEQFNDGDGNYPEPAPDGSLYVMVQCGGKTFLARSTDEASTWPIVHVHGKPLTIPPTNELRVDPKSNLYSVEQRGDRLLLRVSRDGGLAWSSAEDVLAPGARGLEQWFVAVRRSGQVAFAYLAHDGSRPGYDAYLTTTRTALSRSPVFFSAILNDPRTPLDASAGTPAKDDFIGVDIGPDGSAWGAFYADCTPRAPECSDGQGFDFEANRAFAGRLVWPAAAGR